MTSLGPRLIRAIQNHDISGVRNILETATPADINYEEDVGPGPYASTYHNENANENNENNENNNNESNDVNLYTPLKWAVNELSRSVKADIKENIIDIFKLLFDHGALYPEYTTDVEEEDYDLVYDIRQHGSIPAFRHLLENQDEIDISIETIIELVINYPRPEAYLKVIFDNSKYNVNTPLNKHGEGVLFFLARPLLAGERVEDRVNTINEMLRIGANPFQVNDIGETPVAKGVKIRLDGRILNALNYYEKLGNTSVRKPSNVKNISGQSAANYVKIIGRYSTTNERSLAAKPHLTRSLAGGARRRRVCRTTKRRRGTKHRKLNRTRRSP